MTCLNRRRSPAAVHCCIGVNVNRRTASAVKAKFHYAIWSQTGSKLVADLQRAEIWPII